MILHSRMPEKIQELEALATRPDVVYRDYGVNRGLAKSWNEGILWAHEQASTWFWSSTKMSSWEPGTSTGWQKRPCSGETVPS